MMGHGQFRNDKQIQAQQEIDNLGGHPANCPASELSGATVVGVDPASNMLGG